MHEKTEDMRSHKFMLGAIPSPSGTTPGMEEVERSLNPVEKVRMRG